MAGELQRLDCMLATPAADVLDRARTAWAMAADADDAPIVLFGAGNLGRMTLAGLRRAGRLPVAFADNGATKWGTRIDGIEVMSPAEAVQRFGAAAVFVVTIWGSGQPDRMANVLAAVKAHGAQRVVPFLTLYWRYAEVFLPYFAADLPHKVVGARRDILRLWNELADGHSKDEFAKLVEWRLTGDFSTMPVPTPGPQYWPTDVFSENRQERFVDCGAFDGDTLQVIADRYANRIAEIMAFEPDPGSFVKLMARVATFPTALRERVTLRQQATGGAEGELSFIADGTGAAKIGAGDVKVQATTLDKALADRTPTYIKMDIEGAEIDAVHGAVNVIRRSRPVLAVCAYHLQDHLWRVPLTILDLFPNYRVFLRTYCNDGFETVCYGVPVERLIRA